MGWREREGGREGGSESVTIHSRADVSNVNGVFARRSLRSADEFDLG